MPKRKIRFITLEEAIQLYTGQINEFGGALGVRDMHLLASALGTPSATFGKRYLHKDIFEMATAYAYHLIKNHPFVDGNKRIGMLIAISFLRYNGVILDLDSSRVYALAIGIASSKISKDDVAKLLGAWCIN